MLYAQDVLNVYADNGSVVARIPGAHLVPKLRHKLGKYRHFIREIDNLSKAPIDHRPYSQLTRAFFNRQLFCTDLKDCRRNFRKTYY